MAAGHYYFGRIGTVRGDPLLAHLECTFSSGTPTIDTATSDPGITITRDAAGDYDVAGLPGGTLLHPVSMGVDLASDTPADTTVGYAQPRSCNAGAGTCKILTFARDDGDQDDPPDGARLSATFLVTERGTPRILSPLEVPSLRLWVSDDVTGAGTAGFQVTDLSGRGNHGTQATTGNQPTVSGGLLNFAAASAQFVTIPASVLAGVNKFAIVARAVANEDIPTTRQILMRTAASNIQFVDLLTATGNVDFWLAGDVHSVIPGASVAANQLNSYTYLFDRGAQSVRLNGQQVDADTAASTSISASASDLLLGSTSGLYWNGGLQHLFIVAGRIPTEAELRFLETYVE